MGMRLEAVDEEAKIRCGQRRGRISQVVTGEEIANVDCVEQDVHLGRSDGWEWREVGIRLVYIVVGR